MTGKIGKLSNYPHGFGGGVTLRNVPLFETHAGKVFWVYNGSGIYGTQKAGSNGNKGTFNEPFSTLDYAIGQCTANRGDIIMVKPGHSETISSDAGVTLDVAGVSVIGLGNGSDRPTFTVSTAAAANMSVTAANVTLHNLVFLGNKNDLVNCLEIAGDSCEVSHCEFRESTNGMIAAISVGLADGDSVYAYIHDCNIWMDEPGVTNVGDAGIEIVKDSDHIRIENCYIYGDFDDAGIHVPAGGNACDQLVIKGNYVENTASGAHAIEITTGGTMNGGAIVDNYLVSDASATLLEPHTLQTVGNRGSLGGTNSADFPVPGYLAGLERSARVVTKATGSMASGFGTTDSPVAMFTVTGEVAVRGWGIVTTNLSSTSNTGTISLGTADSTAALIPAATADGTELQAGDVWFDSTSGTDAGALPDDGSWVILADGANIVMTIGTNDITGGAIDVFCEWAPISADGNVVAA